MSAGMLGSNLLVMEGISKTTGVQSESPSQNWFSRHKFLSYLFAGLIIAGIVGAFFWLRNQQLYGRVEIHNLEPESGPIGTLVTIKGLGFSKKDNFIKFDEGLSPAASLCRA